MLSALTLFILFFLLNLALIWISELEASPINHAQLSFPVMRNNQRRHEKIIELFNSYLKKYKLSANEIALYNLNSFVIYHPDENQDILNDEYWHVTFCHPNLKLSISFDLLPNGFSVTDNSPSKIGYYYKDSSQKTDCHERIKYVKT